MYDITIVFTHHRELGKCNSDELYKIIESINPDVIFEELSSEMFEIIYNSIAFNLQSDGFTEIKCIKKYLQNHNINHIPVDIDAKYLSDKEQDWMYDTFEDYEDYIRLDIEQSLLTERYGFDFLNSDKCLDLSEQKNIIIKGIIEIGINKSELLRVHQLFIRQEDSREKAMLQNIFGYSKENQYNQAVFLVGSGHRKSIMQKIKSFEKLAQIKLNWTLYGNE